MRIAVVIVFGFLVLSLAGCTTGSITGGETNGKFEQSIKEKYLVGSDEQLLIHDYTAKGYNFSTEPNGSRWLDKKSHSIWCDDRHQIRWSVDANGKIKNIGAGYGQICP